MDRGSRLMTSTVGTTSLRGGGVGRGRSDADVDADADEEEEAREGGDVGEDEELIARGGNDTVDAAGGRGGGGTEGRSWGTDKVTAENRGITPEGRGEGQSPRAVGGRLRPSVFFDSATYDKRGGGTGVDPRAASRRTASKPVERPPRRTSPRPSPTSPYCSGTSCASSDWGW